MQGRRSLPLPALRNRIRTPIVCRFCCFFWRRIDAYRTIGTSPHQRNRKPCRARETHPAGSCASTVHIVLPLFQLAITWLQRPEHCRFVFFFLRRSCIDPTVPSHRQRALSLCQGWCSMIAGAAAAVAAGTHACTMPVMVGVVVGAV